MDKQTAACIFGLFMKLQYVITKILGFATRPHNLHSLDHQTKITASSSPNCWSRVRPTTRSDIYEWSPEVGGAHLDQMVTLLGWARATVTLAAWGRPTGKTQNMVYVMPMVIERGRSSKQVCGWTTRGFFNTRLLDQWSWSTGPAWGCQYWTWLDFGLSYSTRKE